MNSTQQQLLGFTYALGEEVVARLDDADVYSFDHQQLVPRAFCPGWTIATVIDCIVRAGGRHYVLSFHLRSRTFVCVVPEDMIDGVA